MLWLSTKIWFRRLVKNLTIFILSYGSYTLGYIIATLLFLYVHSQTIYNKCYPDNEYIFRVIKEDHAYNSQTPRNPYILAETIRENVPSVSHVTGFCKAGRHYIEKNGEVYSETGLIAVDPEFFDLFSIRFLRGVFDRQSFSSPYNMIVSRSIALKYFNTLEVVDSILTFNETDPKYTFNIVGVVEDLPEKSTIQGSMFINIIPSFNYILKGFESEKDDWDNFYFETYVELFDENPLPATTAINEVIGSQLQDYQNFTFRFQRIKDIYLES